MDARRDKDSKRIGGRSLNFCLYAFYVVKDRVLPLHIPYSRSRSHSLLAFPLNITLPTTGAPLNIQTVDSRAVPHFSGGYIT